MKYEEKFGVKVDVHIPKSDKRFLYALMGAYLKGTDRHNVLEKRHLTSKYEHLIFRLEPVELPPDPFKVLEAYAKKANLDEIIRERISHFPPGQEYHINPQLIKDFTKITGLYPLEHWLIGEIPNIKPDGRIPIPTILGVRDANTLERVELGDRVMERIKLPTTHILELPSGTKVREVFEFDNGYRIELVSK